MRLFSVSIIQVLFSDKSNTGALALRILESRSDVVVTYITSTVAYGRIIGEVKRWPSARFEAVEARLK